MQKSTDRFGIIFNTHNKILEISEIQPMHVNEYPTLKSKVPKKVCNQISEL